MKEFPVRVALVGVAIFAIWSLTIVNCCKSVVRPQAQTYGVPSYVFDDVKQWPDGEMWVKAFVRCTENIYRTDKSDKAVWDLLKLYRTAGLSPTEAVARFHAKVMEEFEKTHYRKDLIWVPTGGDGG